MRFKALSKDFSFNENILEEKFPNYFRAAISDWIFHVIDKQNLGFNHYQYATGNNTPTAIEHSVWSEMQTILRVNFPQLLDQLYVYLFENQGFLIEFLNLLLQNYADSDDAVMLEKHLSQGGSAYRVGHESGSVYHLEKRVPDVVVESSKNALANSQILKDAWKSCYKHNPDYEKTVSLSVDFIEGYFRDIYWPKDARTKSVFNIVQYFVQNPKKLSFKGSSFLKDSIHLLKLLEGVSTIRGEHTTGSGRSPTKDEAEYILHTSIYIWNLMR